MIGARMAITMGRIKSFFKGSHYVAESYTLKFDKADNSYIVEHYTMTHDEEKQFYEAVAEQQAKIMKMMMPTNEPVIPIIDIQKSKEEKWAEDVEKNRQKQLAQNKKVTAKPKTQTTPTMEAKPKRKYYKPKANTQGATKKKTTNE